MISFRNVSCFLCFPVKNDKCFLAYTTYLVWFAANKSKVLTDPKRNINPKNKSTLHWPIALKLLSTLNLVNFHNEHLYNAKSSWQMKFSTKFPRELNQISSTCCCRIKRGEAPSLCVSRGEMKNGHISNTFYVRKSLAVLLFCSKPDHDAFLHKHHVASWAKKETRSTLLVFALLTLSSPCETIASDNLACSQLSRSHGSEPKMIYTHRFLNINHRAQPSCKTDVRQCVCTVVVHLDRTWLSVNTARLSGPIFLFKCCYFSLVLFFYINNSSIFSDWLLHFILCFPHLAVQIFSSIYT